MIKFLLQRPISVVMAFTACFILGLITYLNIPISLLPDIAIPQITVQIQGDNLSARELENSIVAPIRQQLLQVTELDDIESETTDGGAIISMDFNFGTNTDLAFIEVNEKIDAAMAYLPREVQRPRVIKASATDIPVFYLNLTLKENPSQSDLEFAGLSTIATEVIRRRIEQIPEIAMVDVTGLVRSEVQVKPDMQKLQMLDISLEDIEHSLKNNNVEPGSMQVRDGYYEYNVKFSSVLRTVEDVQNIYIRKGDRILQLKELADISLHQAKEKGASFSKGKRAITLAIIKQSDESMENMKKALAGTIEKFEQDYPNIEFTITRNQTELLDFTISNLKQNLLLGFIFICFVAILFLGDVKSPLVIGVSMVVSIVISLLFFYLFDISLNIISISGLILALGMMIDSAIIVTENIEQYRSQSLSLEEACDKGTTEVITPMLSSTFTTIAVFLPLVFLSGIAGAIFFDQAFAVTVGLLVSYVTGIFLLPVLYKVIYSIPEKRFKWIHFKINNLVKGNILDKFYDKAVDFVFKYKRTTMAIVIAAVPLCVWLFTVMPVSRMPEIQEHELMVHVEWNENIHLQESKARIASLYDTPIMDSVIHTAYLGPQQYLLNSDDELTSTEAELYIRCQEPSQVPVKEQEIVAWFQENYPDAIVGFYPPESIFEKLFDTSEATIVAELYARNKSKAPSSAMILAASHGLVVEDTYQPDQLPFEPQLEMRINHEKVLLYQVDINEIYRILRTSFHANEVTTLRSYQQFLPIRMVDHERNIDDILSNTLVNGSIPLSELVTVTYGQDLKMVTAGKNGEYLPMRFYDVEDPQELLNALRERMDGTVYQVQVEEESNSWDMFFSGSYFSNKQMLQELVVVLLISILLMYFILAAQFESFVQPLIVLIEIPIDVASALILLWLTGHTLNLMSAIGIVVTCGVIINDSILKIDAINELRKAGTPLMEAIHTAGRRRLRPIIMTSLTTICGMIPLLFTNDMGSELQKPLSIAMIAAMGVGTMVSLLVIPVAYWYIYKKKAHEE